MGNFLTVGDSLQLAAGFFNKCLDFPPAQVSPLFPVLLTVEELAYPMRIERLASFFHSQLFEHLKIPYWPLRVGIKRRFR